MLKIIQLGRDNWDLKPDIWGPKPLLLAAYLLPLAAWPLRSDGRRRFGRGLDSWVCTLPVGRHARLADTASPILLISVVAPEGPRSKGEGLPTLAQALSGVWEGAWNSGSGML